jgi:hypothetical protein
VLEDRLGSHLLRCIAVISNYWATTAQTEYVGVFWIRNSCTVSDAFFYENQWFGPQEWIVGQSPDDEPVTITFRDSFFQEFWDDKDGGAEVVYENCKWGARNLPSLSQGCPVPFPSPTGRGPAAGAIAGIVIAVIAVIGIGVGAGVFMWFRKKPKKSASDPVEIVRSPSESSWTKELYVGAHPMPQMPSSPDGAAPPPFYPGEYPGLPPTWVPS